MDTPDTVKVVNLVKLLHDMVANERDTKPFLLSIGEKAEKIAAAFRDRQMSTEDALDSPGEPGQGDHRGRAKAQDVDRACDQRHSLRSGTSRAKGLEEDKAQDRRAKPRLPSSTSVPSGVCGQIRNGTYG